MEEEENNICGPSEVPRQVPSKSRSITTKGGGNYERGGGPTASKTTSIITTFEQKGRGEHIGKTASVLHTISKKSIHQFGEKTGRGKIGKNQEYLGNLTPTKRKLIQNQNLQTLIDSFESTAVESTLNRNEQSESPAKRRKYNLMTEVINPIGQGYGDGTI